MDLSCYSSKSEIFNALPNSAPQLQIQLYTHAGAHILYSVELIVKVHLIHRHHGRLILGDFRCLALPLLPSASYGSAEGLCP